MAERGSLVESLAEGWVEVRLDTWEEHTRAELGLDPREHVLDVTSYVGKATVRTAAPVDLLAHASQHLVLKPLISVPLVHVPDLMALVVLSVKGSFARNGRRVEDAVHPRHCSVQERLGQVGPRGRERHGVVGLWSALPQRNVQG